MHYCCLVALPPIPAGSDPEDQPDVEELVAGLMAPYDEGRGEYDDDAEAYTDGIERWWDWWQIGGRWTGFLNPDYDPHTDPANIETCSLCGGTGTRPDAATFGAEWVEANNGCNGCEGVGLRASWPTQWVKYDGDIRRLGDVRALVEANPPFRLLGPEIMVACETYNPDGRWPDRDAGETPDDVPNEERKFIQHPERVVEAIKSLSDDCTVVVVDYHC